MDVVVKVKVRMNMFTNCSDGDSTGWRRRLGLLDVDRYWVRFEHNGLISGGDGRVTRRQEQNRE
jgi:hypothetical protein